jgi:hypothetical protein
VPSLTRVIARAVNGCLQESICLSYSEAHLRSIVQLLEAIEAHPVYERLGRLDLPEGFKDQEAQEDSVGCCSRKVGVWGGLSWDV